jgi:16S rRNA (cytosine967-C5)-methyltransferase
MIERNQLANIIKVISAYSCSKPLHFFLKTYFLQHRNMGSRDRNIMRTYVYNYFRLGTSFDSTSIEEKIAIATFLLTSDNNSLSDYCIGNYSLLDHSKIILSLDEKIKFVSEKYPGFTFENIFAFSNYLSPEINLIDFSKSFLIQPDVWIRIRKSNYREVIRELDENKIEFTIVHEMKNSLGFKNSVKLDQLRSFKKGYFEIQDISSQKTGDYFQPHSNEKWWDCCAGSGGKSLMLAEQGENIKITATDNRDSILKNLHERFKKAQLSNYKIKNADLIKPESGSEAPNYYDGIIADVPCSGSGTWSRTPEMLFCFKENEIEKYASLQKNILRNVVTSLKKGKPLIYITCSVFKKENEEVIDYVVHNLNLNIERSEYLIGYRSKADTLFVARFLKK